MIIDNTNYWRSSVRSLMTRVELYSGSALADAYTAYYALKEFTVERVGEENKFFGYGVCQKMNLKLVDKNRLITITPNHSLKGYLSTGGELISSFPVFYVERVNRSENTNDLSVTAYDALYGAVAHTVSELSLTSTSYSVLEFASACAELIGCERVVTIGVTDDSFNTSYTEAAPANFEGTETIRSALDAIAEVTQTIYYINNNNELVFKRLDISGEPVLTIDKEDYISLESGANRRLATVAYVTELGNNVAASIEAAGSTQYIRNNPFWELREDISTLVDNALAATGNLTINQFSCSWRGNPALEIGDKIELETKDNEKAISYVLDDVINYTGALSQQTQWNYTEDSADTPTNPTSLGEKLNQTFARVDKVNREIGLKVSYEEMESSIKLSEENIISQVGDAAELVETKVDKEGFEITVSETLATNAIEGLKIQGKNYRFDDQGLTIAALEDAENSTKTLLDETGLYVSESGLDVLTANKDGVVARDLTIRNEKFTLSSEALEYSDPETDITTRIDGEGMTISKASEEVLTVESAGVSAVNLHATTYLIVGDNSRFEDYQDGSTQRTACYWIG